MSTQSILHPFFGFALVCGLLSACHSQPKQEEEQNAHLGEIHFEVSATEAAKPHFHKGLLLLHSFEYQDAREAFLKAQEADPDFAMAYWGEAMTYNHNLWREQDYEKGQAALQKLGATPEERRAKAGTDLERDLLGAVEALYGEGDKFERDQAYSAYLAGLYEKYPGNHEVAAFYALSVLGAVPVGRDAEAFEKGALIAKGILAENPNHPGALHYLIHSYDDPGHARLALNAADSYARVAPDAAHALHMPSHIYVALGMWDEVVSSNIASYGASVKRMERKALDNNARSYHALHWLLYGYLQQGRYEKARGIMDDMQRYTAELPSKNARSYMVLMKAAYLCETNDWDNPIADIAVDLSELNITNWALYRFIDGMKAFHAGDTAALRRAILTMQEERQEESLRVTDAGVPMCSAAGANRSAPNKLDIGQAQVMEMELRGLYAWKQGNTKETEKWLREAADLEDQLSYDYGPPTIARPSSELYGEWLLDQGRNEEAHSRFETALQRGPKRIAALRGKARAAQRLGNENEAREINTLIETIRKEGDKMS